MNKGRNMAKRNVISLATKKLILQRLAEGEGSTALGKEFGLGESTIRGIQKRAHEINTSSNCATKESVKRASYSRNALIVKTEKALILWIEELTQKRIPITGDLIKEKALQFYNQLKDLEPLCSSSSMRKSKFSASSGWLAGFLDRNALHNLRTANEAASADEKSAKNYYKVLAKIIDEGDYCPDQVFNADKTGLCWKKMPSSTFIGQSEKTASDKVTFLICSNASGARVLKPLMINNSMHPNAIMDKNVAQLPVHFMANKNACVSTAVFNTWFNECFVPEVEQYMTDMGLTFNVLLIIDNTFGNFSVEHPNVKVVLLPPNSARLIQPLEQGVIEDFKKHYVKLTFRHILEKLQNDAITLTDVWKELSILDCVNHAAAAFREIKQHTLNSCWKAIWPECVIKRNAAESTLMLTSEIITLAHCIDGEGFDSFSESDLVEMIQEETVSEHDIINHVTDITGGSEDSDKMTATAIYEGLKLCHKLECHFLEIDANSERTSKFQKELQSCISDYQEMYMRLVKTPPSQKLITDYLVTQKRSNLNECEVISISDESDLDPLEYAEDLELSVYEQ